MPASLTIASPLARLCYESEKAGRAARQGDILEIIEMPYGTRYRVHWDDGHESTFRPVAGSAQIVRREKPAPSSL